MTSSRLRQSPTRIARACNVEPRIVQTFMMLAVLALTSLACNGADVELGVRKAPKPAVADPQPELNPVAVPVAPVCLADSDCSALASQPCALAACEVSTHRCVVVPRADFTTCSTGLACDVGACLAGACIAVDHLDAGDCDDGNPCTQDQCQDNKGGCTHVGSPFALCSDGNPCTTDDHCELGACQASQNACACAGAADCAGFADGDKCAGQLLCSEGVCVPDPTSQPQCDDGNPCTKDGCEGKTGACTHSPVTEGSVCDDGDACTLHDRCLSGKCASGGVLPCTINGSGCAMTCDAKLGCVAAMGGEPGCDDGNPCTKSDACHAGACVGTLACECQVDSDCTGKVVGPACMGKAACSAGKCVLDADLAEPCKQAGASGHEFGGCSVQICTPAGCLASQKPIDTSCESAGYCTYGDRCDAQGQCKSGVTLQCDDGDACTVDTCNLAKVTCQHAPDQAANGKACDDGNPCTTGESCVKTTCQGGKSACNDGDPCTADLCDPTALAVGPGGKFACIHKKLPEGAACDDGDACTIGGLCNSGSCVFAVVQTCDDGNPCTEDSCDGIGGCTHNAVKQSEPVACDDGDSCTSEDTCVAGACKGLPGSCQCQATKDCAGFEDGNLCNGTLVCLDHACVVAATSVVTCPASNNPCVTVQCQANTGVCVDVALTGSGSVACTDNNACTVGDACLPGGVCGAGKPVACDDGLACTGDQCDPVQGCVFAPWGKAAGVPCDDANPCTFGDVCDAGGCAPGKNACQCQSDVDCGPYDDADACNGGLLCKSGTCVSDGKSVTCAAASGPCVQSQCDPGSGKCLTLAIPDGTLCDAPASCASGGQCQAGSCVGAVIQGCNDQNPCTNDTCVAQACTHTVNVGTPCDDGNSCSTGEKCDAIGQCGGGQNGCNCKVDGDCPDDGDLCNGKFECNGGTCQPKANSVVTCDVSKDDACQKTACDKKSGQCVVSVTPAGGACSDGDACTQGDACAGGKCAGGGTISCDDGVFCTSDGCNPASGCYHLQSNSACDDGNPCTLGDQCQAGACVGQGGCDCATDGDCAAKDDGNSCNGFLKCKTGKCQLDVATVVTCDPSQVTACTVPLCDPKTGTCGPSPVPEGTGCNDADACTTQDKCAQGKCVGTVLSCDDKNPCTSEACDVKAGCVIVANSAPCDDGNACTSGDTCKGGSCTSGQTVGCDDKEPCTTDSCDAKAGCLHSATVGGCDDGNPCTQGDSCNASGKCGSGANVCNCVQDGDCKQDADACNGVLSCQANQCVTKPGTVVVCDASGDTPCLVNTCDPKSGTCAGVASAAKPCDDASLCTTGDACTAGKCVGNAIGCDDLNPCTTDSCDAKLGCQHVNANGGLCSDGNNCTLGDQCQGGQCIAGANQCNCSKNADCAKFDDGNLCNGTYSCNAGQCKPDASTIVTCPPAPDGCTLSACDPGQGKCITLAAPNGAVCDDGNACTTAGQCFVGNCLVKPISCDDANPCTADSCSATTGCANKGLPTFPPTTCNDGNPCTNIDACVGGKCQGLFNTCQCKSDTDCKDDANLCNGFNSCQGGTCKLKAGSIVVCSTVGDTACAKNTCFPATGLCLKAPAPPGTSCDDASACTGGDVCSGGVCFGVPLDCQDNVACTLDSCDPKAGCVNVANVGACGDNDACTDDVCDPIGGCIHQAKTGVPCDDANSCTQGEQCGLGPNGPKCFGGTQINCDDKNVCTSDSCSLATGQCSHVKAVGCCASAADCSDGNACTVDSCTANQCVFVASGDPTCCNAAADCDDSQVCTTDTCVNAKCAHAAANGTLCSDNNLCTQNDACNGGVCKAGTNTVCNDGNVCTSDSCNPINGGCVLTPNAGSCSDGNLCTLGDLCSGSGVCSAGKADTCDDKLACTTDSCNPQTGCVHQPLPGFAADFDDGTLGGIATQSLNPQIKWSLDSQQVMTKPNALYVGRILPNGTHTYNAGPTVATATLPGIAIPAGVANAVLTFDLNYDRDKNEPAGCGGFADSFSVQIGNQIVSQTCKNTGGFVAISVPLTAQVGQTVAISFSFISNLNQNNGQGAWLDNVKVNWACP